ncbi:MAG: OmpA family protein [Bryobacteraceae bacterium]|jgi:outer membrane protein OmpA-like peptidoglycan-associated protein
MFAKVLSSSVLSVVFLSAQVPNPTQQPPPPSQEDAATPIFRVEVVGRTAQAVNYRHRGGSTKVNFQGTALMPMAKGEAKVESERGNIHISADFGKMQPPSSFGPEYLTYVLWAISPDGRPQNLGELTLSDYGAGSSSKIDTTSPIQTFGMIVTAEPYYGVTQPSDVVVMENVIRPDTMGVVELIDAKYELLPRGMYTAQGRARGFVPIRVSKKQPFELYEAENALQLSRIAGANKYASESFQKAEDALQQAQRYQAQKPGQKPVITMAREAVVRAEDARVIAIRREQDEAQEKERQASLDRENAAKAQAAQEAAQRAQAEAEAQAQTARRVQADQARAAAEQAKAEALAAEQEAKRQMALAEQAKAEADTARAAALAQQQQLAQQADQSRLAAQEADRLRMKAEQDQAQLRQQLLDQFNQILQTRDTARGLIVNMSDVLFDSGKYTLKPGARERLAKISGIILGHPGLRIEVEGHTDSVGGDEYNMRLSENRASTVRDYLVAEGIPQDNVTSKGFGKIMPVADNGTAAGRQQNRRVELVVSGEIIGTSLSAARTSSGGSAAQPSTAVPPR